MCQHGWLATSYDDPSVTSSDETSPTRRDSSICHPWSRTDVRTATSWPVQHQRHRTEYDDARSPPFLLAGSLPSLLSVDWLHSTYPSLPSSTRCARTTPAAIWLCFAQLHLPLTNGFRTSRSAYMSRRGCSTFLLGLHLSWLLIWCLHSCTFFALPALIHRLHPLFRLLSAFSVFSFFQSMTLTSSPGQHRMSPPSPRFRQESFMSLIILFCVFHVSPISCLCAASLRTFYLYVSTLATRSPTRCTKLSECCNLSSKPSRLLLVRLE